MAHGGRIWIEGVPAGGTAVVVELPVARCRTSERRATVVSKVLVVDDEPQIRRALRTSLGAHGYEVRTAANGEEAIVAAAEETLDLVFLDLGLPDLDGTEVIRRIRSFSDVPIIVLSVRDRQADKVDALDAGADDYVTKPFGVEEVLGAAAGGGPQEPGRASRLPATLVFDDLEIDLGRQLVTVGGDRVHLDEDRVRPARGARDQPGQAAHAPVAPAPRLGDRLRRGEPLPPRLRQSAASQARR